jgi:hypothetical protein
MFNREKNDFPAGPRCSSCGSPIGEATVCSCGKATANMSFEERTEYELAQYRAYKERVASA